MGLCSVVVLLCGEIEALEKELVREVEDLVMHGVVVELPCKGALEGLQTSAGMRCHVL